MNKLVFFYIQQKSCTYAVNVFWPYSWIQYFLYQCRKRCVPKLDHLKKKTPTYKRHDNMDEQFFNKYAYKIVFINLFSLFQIFNHAIFRWYVRFTQGICPFCFFLVIYNIWKYNIFQVLTNISSFFFTLQYSLRKHSSR